MTFGTGYAGYAPAGLGTPAGLPAPGAAYVQTVDTVAARALDLAAKDYTVDDDETGSPHDAWDGLAQTVVLRLTTRRGRLPYAPTFGNAFLNLDRLPLDLTGYARKSAAEALGDLIAAGQVELIDVTTDRQGGLAAMIVTWRDTRTGRQRTARAVATGT